MYTCPRGHASQDADYCDECGAPIGPTVGLRPATGPLDGGTPAAPATNGSAPEAPACPRCGTAKAGRFCEVCGHDFLLASIAPRGGLLPATAPAATGAPGPTAAPGPAADITLMADQGTASGTTLTGTATAGADRGAPGQWRLTATPDPAYHARMQAEAEPGTAPIPFPAYCPERRFVLTGRQALIGRRSRSRGIEPEIDLTGPPADPAVSHTHALLLVQPGGGLAVVDLDSANGTYVNDDPEPVEANVPVALADGDRIHVGAWTTLTVNAP